MADVALVDLSRSRAVHLVGVGGAGMSAIGVVLAAMGHRVTGSDVRPTGAWPALEAAGITPDVVEPGALFAAAMPHQAEVVAHSTAFAPTAEDLGSAHAAGAVVVNRAGILAAVCGARRTVAVSGTHGKTSTAAMLATLLDGAGASSSFLIGAAPLGLGTAARWADDDWLVVEADESDGTFERLGAEVAVVTNIDEDHLDFWVDLDAIEAGFDRFLAAARVGVVCLDDPHGTDGGDPRARRLADRHGSVTVGEVPGARLRVHDVVVERLHTTFDLTLDGTPLGPFSILTPGRHHARNAAVAVAVALEVGVGVDEARTALAAYRGVARRFEVVGEVAGITVVDDYAHNPGKVRALLASAREARWGRVVAIFQPHRHTRTRDQAAAFGAALSLADLVAVTDVYGAGEPPIPGVSGRTVLDAVLDHRPWATTAWTPTLDDAEVWAQARLRPGDLCLTVGAGDVADLGPRLVQDLADRSGP